MLTKEQSLLEYDFSRLTVTPDRLTRSTHGHYPRLAEEMLKIYRENIGEVRKHLHDRVRRSLQGVMDCPAKRIAAFCKLLDDASEFHQDKSAASAKLRQRVFSLAATKHPLVQTRDQLFDHDETNTKAEIAAELGKSWEEIEASLFADVIEFHRLRKPPENLDAAGLLSRYNVAQTQTALYGALSMTVWAGDDFKMILRYAKLARLMHSITRQGDRYVFQLNGPASLLRQTRRYGVAFARFLPGLLATRDWRMQATVLGPAKRRFALRLSSTDGLRSEVQPNDFDSQLEETFWRQWNKLQAENQTDGWMLRREGTVLHQAQTVFTPDFSLKHPKHGEVLLEVIGFWTPEYLSEKVIRLKQFQHTARIMLAISETVDQSIPDLGMPRVTFKTTLKVKDILQILPR
ncbi:DUF790 family protein [Novipirellula sp.]|uniref:DUF790 family protein n=1 Tax=Novipirellula sp. TaxID=2795430 RepID=UPI003567368F